MFSVPGEFGDCFHKLFPSNGPTEKSQVGLGQANVGPTDGAPPADEPISKLLAKQ